MSLSDVEIERYARHLVLREIGGPGQSKLKETSVLVVGAGGLGSPVLQNLAAAGIGVLGIVDDDRVSLSNLQRQTIFRSSDIGRSKVAAAAEAIERLNPHVQTRPLAERIDDRNAREAVRSYDLVLDCSDNFETRYALSDAGYWEHKPIILGAIQAFDGIVTTLRPFDASPEGVPNPTYRCLFPEPPPSESVLTCSDFGVVGALTGMIGSIMAMEALRVTLGIGVPLVGKALLVNGRDLRFETLTYTWDPCNALNGAHPIGGKT